MAFYYNGLLIVLLRQDEASGEPKTTLLHTKLERSIMPTSLGECVALYCASTDVRSDGLGEILGAVAVREDLSAEVFLPKVLYEEVENDG